MRTRHWRAVVEDGAGVERHRDVVAHGKTTFNDDVPHVARFQ